jgi:hypothetical protein
MHAKYLVIDGQFPNEKGKASDAIIANKLLAKLEKERKQILTNSFQLSQYNWVSKQTKD